MARQLMIYAIGSIACEHTPRRTPRRRSPPVMARGGGAPPRRDTRYHGGRAPSGSRRHCPLPGCVPHGCRADGTSCILRLRWRLHRWPRPSEIGCVRCDVSAAAYRARAAPAIPDIDVAVGDGWLQEVMPRSPEGEAAEAQPAAGGGQSASPDSRTAVSAASTSSRRCLTVRCWARATQASSVVGVAMRTSCNAASAPMGA